MKRSALLFAPLLLSLVIFSSVAAPGSYSTVPSHGSISYPPQNDYYSLWSSDYRVETDFLNYLTGSFDYTGLFDNLYNKFLVELETTTFGEGYQTPTLNYGSPTYNPGDPVGNLESIATYVVDTTDEISQAITSAQSGDIIFIKAGNYTTSGIIFGDKSDIIIAGEGWNTVLRLEDNKNSYVLSGRGDCNNIIIRDLTIDGNRVNNPAETGLDALEFRSNPSNILIENVKVLNARHMGINVYYGTKLYTINCVSIDSGWNTFQYTRCTWSAAIGNYMRYSRDVAMSTWESNSLVYANNICVYGIHDYLGFNDANWGIGVESEHEEVPSYNIVLRNNVCSEHNQAGPDESWKGHGIHIMDLSYNITIDGNTAENNNRAGIYVAPSDYYPVGSTIVICNNYAKGNNIYNMPEEAWYGNIVVLRDGVILYNNTVG